MSEQAKTINIEVGMNSPVTINADGAVVNLPTQEEFDHLTRKVIDLHKALDRHVSLTPKTILRIRAALDMPAIDGDTDAYVLSEAARHLEIMKS